MNRVVIGIGSNLDPGRNVVRALRRLARAHVVLHRSRFVATDPIGVEDQPRFLNGAVCIETAMSREELAEWIRRTEAEMGRRRTAPKYGPRTIDLDIVAWNGVVVHRDVARREFLRRAVLEVEPGIEMPPRVPETPWPSHEPRSKA